jgi:hypothetical protein
MMQWQILFFLGYNSLKNSKKCGFYVLTSLYELYHSAHMVLSFVVHSVLVFIFGVCLGV